MQIILKGKPRSTGTLYKTMCRGNFPMTYLITKGKELKEDYQWQAKSQWRSEPLKCPLSVTIDIYHDNLRKQDWDNFHKLSMDALTGICYEDDSQIKKATVTTYYDHDNPRIEIEITSL